MNKILLDKMQQRLTQKNVRYATNNNVISFNMNIDDTIGGVAISLHILDSGIVCYATLGNKATQDKLCSIAEYLHRANLGLAYGNFELDYFDGEIRYKYSAVMDIANNVSNNSLDKCIIVPCLMLQQYGKGILTLIYGEGDPQELIEEAESN